jgi:hypothetical protein
MKEMTADFKRLSQRIDELAEKWDTSGAVVILTGDEIVHRKTYGFADRENNLRLSEGLHIPHLGEVPDAAGAVHHAADRQETVFHYRIRWTGTFRSTVMRQESPSSNCSTTTAAFPTTSIAARCSSCLSPSSIRLSLMRSDIESSAMRTNRRSPLRRRTLSSPGLHWSSSRAPVRMIGAPPISCS